MPPPAAGHALLDSALSDLLRDFLEAHALLRRVAALHRGGSLVFEEVQGLVGEGEEHVLYRLKERCHRLFRAEGEGAEVGPAVLFDLAMGSLFHEAMKFRENFYQRVAYGPKVEALRVARVEGAGGLLQEFEKILGASRARQDEALHEAEILLAQSVGQLRRLLDLHCQSGLLARTLVESAAVIEEVFGEGLDPLLASLYGSAGAGFAFAGAAYLESGFYAEAAEAFAAAARLDHEAATMERLGAYAEGMQAYLERRYGAAVERLGAWLDGGAPEPGDEPLAELALSAVSRLGQLVDEGSEPVLPTAAAALADGLRRRLEGAAAAAGR